MVTITVRHNFPQVVAEIDRIGKGARGAAREALNRSAEWAETDVKREMRQVFDRPVPFTLRSLRVYHANTANLTVKLWFRQRTADEDKLWAMPQIAGTARDMKPMERRMQRVGILPAGWMIVPGAAMPLDAYGNASRGEISRILNVLGTYTEEGFNKANAKTRERLRKGSAKKGVYGFAYWINPPGPKRQPHLLPGVYRRVYTAWGTSLKPMLIFIKGARYRARLDFFGITRKAFDKHFPMEFDKAMDSLLTYGSASQARLMQFGPVAPGGRVFAPTASVYGTSRGMRR